MSAGYTDGHAIGDLITIGTNASNAGFTVAGTYENTDTAAGDRDEFAVGLQYTTGPWTVGAGYAEEESVSEVGAGWVTYGLAPGVLITAGVEYSDANGVAGSDFGGVTYLTMRF